MTHKDIVDTGHPLRRVVEVEYLGGHRVHVQFDDGREGDVDFSSLVQEGIFQALRDQRAFARFGLERGTLVWSGQLDVSPEYLYGKLH